MGKQNDKKISTLLAEPATPLANALLSQVGNYGVSGNPALELASKQSDDSTNPLFEGIETYKKTYAGDVKEFCKNRGLDIDKYQESINKGTFFREIFVQFMAQIADDTKGDVDRIQSSKKDKIKLADLLGPEGAELYKSALSEEANSQEYRQALLSNSTTPIPHEENEPPKKLAQRPIVFVAGPSACGKSYAAESALKEAVKFLPEGDEKHGVDKVIAVDGGKAREVSQMRKLVLKAANNKGYLGIEDLHDQSKVLEKAKDAIYTFALERTNCGMVIPETFSTFGYPPPLDKSKEKLRKAIDCPNAAPIFTRVVGKKGDLPNDPEFQNAVAYMGNSRAWMSEEDFKHMPEEIDLNSPTYCESKAYNGRWFKAGVDGSKSAEKWFRQNSPSNLRMIITNDLVLKRFNGSKWVTAEADDIGAIKISERVFNNWVSRGMTEDLIQFRDKKENRVPSLIETSCSIQYYELTAQVMNSITDIQSRDMNNADLAKLKELLIMLNEAFKNFNQIPSLLNLKNQIEKAEGISTCSKKTINLYNQTAKMLVGRIDELDPLKEIEPAFKEIKKISRNRSSGLVGLAKNSSGLFRAKKPTSPTDEVSVIKRMDVASAKTKSVEAKPAAIDPKKVRFEDDFILPNIKKIETNLPEWKIVPAKDESNHACYDVKKDKSEFRIYPEEIKTKDTQTQTFEAMLRTYQLMYPEDGIPLIITSNTLLQAKWDTAIKNVYPGVEYKLDEVIQVKIKTPITEERGKEEKREMVHEMKFN